MPRIIIIAIISLAAIGLGVIANHAPAMPQSPAPLENRQRICFDQHCFTVEVAQTADERRQGLMHRETLERDRGMLFIFETARRPSFWMKNTYVSLDIVWLDANWRVVHIERNVPPCESDPCPSYRPNADALYVLEVNAGAAEPIAVGDVAGVSGL